MRIRWIALALAATLAFAGLGSPAQAGPLTLQDLINAGATGTDFTLANGVVINVSNVSYILSNLQPQYTAPSASNVIVTTAQQGMNYGLSFNGGYSAYQGGSVDVALNFEVKVVSPAVKISDIAASAVLSTTGTTGLAQLSELVKTTSNYQLASGTMTPTASTFNATFMPQSSIVINKDLLLAGGSDTTSTATASNIQQLLSFSGTVPEPTSMALLGIGMTGLLAFRRFFKRTAVA
jgi:hypothetical protein